MHTYHISYATGSRRDYIRARRYLPLKGQKLKGTKLKNEYFDTKLFQDKKWIHITVIKQAKDLWMEFKHPDKTLLCHFENEDKPTVDYGRIGLRMKPKRKSQFKNFKIMTTGSTTPNQAKAKRSPKQHPWQDYTGKAGPRLWRCNVISPDPKNDGPDGINIHDFDGDGHLDVFSNYEQGYYSRLYFNPGPDAIRKPWTDFIEFKHGQCEDSGIGDLDDDGDIDYIANGGWIYFNPGKADLRDSSKWTKMTLFDKQQRVPTVTDVDGDGLNDLIVGAHQWYRQPKTQKHLAQNWVKYTIGKNRWAMNCIMTDVDKDGAIDIVVPDRGIAVCWYKNPGKDKVTGPWQRKLLHKQGDYLFMAVADVNADRIDDFIIAGGKKGDYVGKLIVLLRTNKTGDPTFTEILIDQPCGNIPKGIAVMDLDGDPARKEILVIPKKGDIWMAAYKGDPMQPKNWQATPLTTPGAETRTKMDNAFLGDLDGDGDLDVATTEENGGWGVIWFENPEK